MTSVTYLVAFTLAAITSSLVYGTVNHVPLPTIDLEEWWGPGTATTNTNTSITNFTIEFNDTMISDLRKRLTSHRPFTPPLEGTAFEYGFNSDKLTLWVNYLAEDYPFAERAAGLNNYTHYKTYIQGLGIHFMRVKTADITTEEVVPLLIVHGFPGSVREFYESIPYLLSSAKAKGFALDIIIPSLPGFGFSDGAVRPGLGVDKAAVIFRNLMNRLGYSKYYIQGGDMGGLVTNCLATLFPDEVLGYHTNFPLLHNPDILFRFFVGQYYPDEIADSSVIGRIYPLTNLSSFVIGFTGYLHLQATKPDSFGFGVTDSPSALLTKVLPTTTGVPTAPANNLTAVQMLDNYMLYWTNNCITTAMRLYAETFNKRYIKLRINEIRSPVPTWVLQAPSEIIYLPAWMIKLKFTNLLGETLPSAGGHFYAWTFPEKYATDVIDAIDAFRSWHVMNSTLYSSCSSYITN